MAKGLQTLTMWEWLLGVLRAESPRGFVWAHQNSVMIDY